MSIKIGGKLYRTDKTRLNLSHCGLSELPDSIGNFKNLKILVLTCNNFTILPQSICDLSMLEELHINNNKIESLPENINKLHNLHTLNAHHNNLTTLPETIYGMHNLRILDMRDNKIQNISLKIKNIPVLRFNEYSYQLNNLSSDCEILIIDDLVSKLENLPSNIKEIHLLRPSHTNFSKIPLGCVLYVNGGPYKNPQ